MAEIEIVKFETMMELVPDSATVYKTWREVVRDYRVVGVRVHDARLVAAMLAHGIPNLLALNVQDFARYEGLIERFTRGPLSAWLARLCTNGDAAAPVVGLVEVGATRPVESHANTCENRLRGSCMQTTVNLPDALYRQSEALAASRGATVEQLIVDAIQKEVQSNLDRRDPVDQGGHEAELPVIRSARPGSLDLSDFDFDDLVA
jgi:predicted transcriptional regulator